jgi:hypothetical protein
MGVSGLLSVPIASGELPSYQRAVRSSDRIWDLRGGSVEISLKGSNHRRRCRASSDFPFGRSFPADHLTYRSDRIVEYETPMRSQGLGTYYQLPQNSHSIRGVAILTPDFDLRFLALRLPPNMNDIAPVILRPFEAGH